MTTSKGITLRKNPTVCFYNIRSQILFLLERFCVTSKQINDIKQSWVNTAKLFWNVPSSNLEICHCVSNISFHIVQSYAWKIP